MAFISTERRRAYIRLLLIMDAADEANLCPLPSEALHALAYLSDVLAPVWGLEPFEGTIYKQNATPYYPTLQEDVDQMVGWTLFDVSSIKYIQTLDGRCRFAGDISLNRALAAEALEEAKRQSEHSNLIAFLREIALALSASYPSSLAGAAQRDANYSDPRVSVENVVDFAEWDNQNSSAQFAGALSALIPGRGFDGQQVNLYIRHLQSLTAKQDAAR